MATAKLWQFVVHKNGPDESWTWRRARPDGTPLEVSAGARASYGKVISDAIKHGFRPQEDRWIVTDSASITHFEPWGNAGPPRRAANPPAAAKRKKKRRSRGTAAGKGP